MLTASLPPPPPARPTLRCEPQVPARAQAARLALRPLFDGALAHLRRDPRATLYLALCQGADEVRAEVASLVAALPPTLLDLTGCDAADVLARLAGEEVARAA